MCADFVESPPQLAPAYARSMVKSEEREMGSQVCRIPLPSRPDLSGFVLPNNSVNLQTPYTP